MTVWMFMDPAVLAVNRILLYPLVLLVKNGKRYGELHKSPFVEDQSLAHQEFWAAELNGVPLFVAFIKRGRFV